ncbi:MAG: UbiA-like polyprenyltransferase [Planctomycetota bacterium]
MADAAPAIPPATSAPRETPPSIGGQFLALGRDIKLSHTVFALPFALWAAVLAAASVDRRPAWTEAILVLLCMILARTFAMTVNRLADAGFDAQNPRTAGRAIPAGRMTRRFAAGAIAATAIGFVAAAAGFWIFRGNPWPLLLAPAVLALLASYSFAKRFTALCHVLLGVALASSPIAAAIAIEPSYLGQSTVWWIAGFVATWVAGFDVIYALADRDVDRQLGLHAIPARFGTNGAVWIARALHVVSLVSLGQAGWGSASLGLATQLAAIAVAVLLITEHVLVASALTKRKTDAAGKEAPLLHHAFFTVNGVVSLTLGAAGMIDAWP